MEMETAVRRRMQGGSKAGCSLNLAVRAHTQPNSRVRDVHRYPIKRLLHELTRKKDVFFFVFVFLKQNRQFNPNWQSFVTRSPNSRRIN